MYETFSSDDAFLKIQKFINTSGFKSERALYQLLNAQSRADKLSLLMSHNSCFTEPVHRRHLHRTRPHGDRRQVRPERILHRIWR